jgi:protein farnesyltransferase/geranylgeranyltransferase type-1 subunit alpha
VDTLIEQDVRNNSAWNQRWFAVHKGHKYPPITIEAASMEAKYVNEYAAQDPYNESPFRYLVALVKEQRKNTDEVGIDVDEKRQASKYTELLTAVEAGMEEMKVELGKGNDCPSLISAYIDVLQIKNDEDSIRKAVDMANDLSMQFDIVRKKYWSMRKTKLLNQVSTLSQDEMI